MEQSICKRGISVMVLDLRASVSFVMAALVAKARNNCQSCLSS
ncbi:hypothetical protein [Bartonella doshiae]|nr:hypothetical protein [Bartonella doshiae]